MKNKNLIVGSGRHAHVLLNELKKKSETFFITNEPNQKDQGILFEGDENINELQQVYNFFFGIGGVDAKTMQRRRLVFNTYTKKNDVIFKNFVSPRAQVEKDLLKNSGIVVMDGVTVQYNAVIGNNVLLNTGSVIEHDVEIADHTHIGPNATICGGVKIGSTTLIGAGSTVVQGLKVGSNSVLGAGSTLTKDIADNELWHGNPAKKIKDLI